MRTAAFDYGLSPDRIAQAPASPRDASRLMALSRGSSSIGHHRFRDLPDLLRPGDLLIANDSRVLAGRLVGRKESGGRVEALLLRRRPPRDWEALIRGRVRPGARLLFGDEDNPAVAVVVAVADGGRRVLRFDDDSRSVLAAGQTPLPPYIKSPLSDAESYQTVYSRVEGSAAAPTAGLHFTPRLMRRLEAAGIAVGFVTLHVGTDTFVPIGEDRVEDHAMHREWCHLPPETARAIAAARRQGGRVVAVGTTAVRVLEAAATEGGVAPFTGWTDLFIVPGHQFRAVDALITNFHLPRTTLLVLVTAFAGEGLTRRAYAEAGARGYRIYSFGDAMLVL